MQTVRKSRTSHPATSNGNGSGDSELAALMGQRIRRLRTQAGKTLRAQAREIGVAPSSLSALENGRVS